MLARTLEPAGRGQLAAVTTWATTIAPLTLVGTHHFLARAAGRAPQDAGAIYGHLYRLSAAAAVVGTIVYLGVASTIGISRSPIPPTVVWLAALIIPGSVFNAAQMQVELGRRALAGYNLARSLFALVYLVAVAGLVLSGAGGLFAFTLAFVAASSLAAIFAGLYIQRRLPAADARASARSFAQTVAHSREFGFAVLFSALASQADKLLLSLLFTAAALGLFAVASAIAQVQHLVGEAFAQLFFSHMTRFDRASDVDTEWLQERLRQMVLIYATVCAGALVALPALAPLIYGRAFASAALLLYVLIPANALRALVRPYEEVFRGLGRPRMSARILAAGVATTAALLATAAAFQSLIGAALAVLAGNAAALAWAVFEGHRALRIRAHAALIPRWTDVRAIAGRIRALARS